MTETTTELAQKIWEGEVFWKYLDQTMDKQIEVLQMFCSELKPSEARNFPLINLEDEDMQWINTQFSKLKRLIAQNLIEPTHTNMQMVRSCAEQYRFFGLLTLVILNISSLQSLRSAKHRPEINTGPR